LFRDRAPNKSEWEVQDFAWEHLAKDDVRVEPTTKQVAGKTVTWTVRVSSHLSDAGRDGEPADGALREETKPPDPRRMPRRALAGRVVAAARETEKALGS
jgi:hypothetical protein